MKKIYITCLLFVQVWLVSAQQLPLFTQYRENVGIINPGAIHNNYLLNQQNMTFGASYRKQWVLVNGSPTTQILRGDWIGVNGRGAATFLAGGYLINDQTGPTGFTGAYGKFGTLLAEDPEVEGLSLGLAFGIVQYRVDVTKLRLHDPGDIEATDDQRKLFPDAGFGAYYYKELGIGNGRNDFFYSGISVPQLLGLNLTFKDANGKFATKRIQHFYGLAGLIHFISETSYLEPSVWVKYTPNAPFNADFNLKYQLTEAFFIGAGCSLSKNIHAETGIDIGESMNLDGNFRIGYGFDYSFSTFGPFAGSTHEFNITYSFGGR